MNSEDSEGNSVANWVRKQIGEHIPFKDGPSLKATEEISNTPPVVKGTSLERFDAGHLTIETLE